MNSSIVPLKFSILIPVYKPQFLKVCIDSVVAQTYQDWELILVNDASPYDLDSIISQYDDSRIKYRKREKGFGARELVKNWNDCLKDATGDYVICMGDDDRLLPNCLSDYAELISKYPGKEVYHMRSEIINDNSEVIDLQEDRPDEESVYSMMWHFMKGHRRQWIGDWLFKTSVLRDKGGYVYFPCAWGSDNITAFMMAQEHGVANTHKPGFQYRNSDFSVSNSTAVTQDKLSAWNEEERWLENFLIEEPIDKLDKSYRKRIFVIMPRMLYNNRLFDLCEDVKAQPIRLFKWIKNRKKYHIPMKMLITATVLSIKNRLF